MKREGGKPGRSGLSTRAVHAGAPAPEPGSPVVQPIVQSTTFLTDTTPGAPVLYTRYGNNPGNTALNEKLAELEGAEAALVVGSGMAAIALTLLSFLGQGDEILAARELYGGSLDLLENELPRYGIETRFVAQDRSWRTELRPNTRVLYAETLSNPLLRVPDLASLGRLGADRGVPAVVDSTFLTPVNLRPIEHGIDVVVHSATKYLGGHSDVTAGVVAGPKAVVDEVEQRMRRLGAVLDPHAIWLLERGIKTLVVRVERQNATALELARRLEGHPQVARVHYPGLASHPDHERAATLLDGFGGMLGLVLRGGDEAARAAAQRFALIRLAPSLGGVETLVSIPAMTSHARLSAAQLKAIGIEDGFLRVSVGIEDVDDLWQDFEQALGDAAG